MYSLRTHAVVKTIELPSLTAVQASREFIVLVCTTTSEFGDKPDYDISQSASQPATLHIFSSRTFTSLYNIPSSSLVPFAHPSLSSTTTETNNAVLPINLDEILHSPHLTAIPQPIFTLSNRLLAYVSPPPRLDSPHEVPSRSPRSATQGTLNDATLKFPLTQAELGVAASKLGVSVLSGMKVLGGMAFSAARAGVTAAATAAERHYSAEVSATPVVPGKFFSRSAPAASGRDNQPRHDGHVESNSVQDAAPVLDTPIVDRQGPSDDTHHITVLDLAPLRSSSSSGPTRVAEFFAGKEQPISLLQFSQDGTMLMVATSGGQTMKVFQLRPAPTGVRHLSGASSIHNTTSLDSPVHMYDLRRGRTSAVVDSLTWAHDGRWVAVATEKGTVHVFATNPYGGPSDEQSHLSGTVVNPTEVVSCCCIFVVS